MNSSEIVKLRQKRRGKEGTAVLRHKTRNHGKHPFLRKVNVTTLEMPVTWSFLNRIPITVHQKLRKQDQKEMERTQWGKRAMRESSGEDMAGHWSCGLTAAVASRKGSS